MKALDKLLIDRICTVAQQAKLADMEDVAAWMQRHLADDLQAARKPRQHRKVEVRVGPHKNKAYIDLAAVKRAQPNGMQ